MSHISRNRPLHPNTNVPKQPPIGSSPVATAPLTTHSSQNDIDQLTKRIKDKILVLCNTSGNFSSAIKQKIQGQESGSNSRIGECLEMRGDKVISNDNLNEEIKRVIESLMAKIKDNSFDIERIEINHEVIDNIAKKIVLSLIYIEDLNSLQSKTCPEWENLISEEIAQRKKIRKDWVMVLKRAYEDIEFFNELNQKMHIPEKDRCHDAFKKNISALIEAAKGKWETIKDFEEYEGKKIFLNDALTCHMMSSYTYNRENGLVRAITTDWFKKIVDESERLYNGLQPLSRL